MSTTVRDCRTIHAKLIDSVQVGNSDQAYAWVRLLCRSMRPLLLPSQQMLTGRYEWDA